MSGTPSAGADLGRCSRVACGQLGTNDKVLFCGHAGAAVLHPPVPRRREGWLPGPTLLAVDRAELSDLFHRVVVDPEGADCWPLDCPNPVRMFRSGKNPPSARRWFQPSAAA
jgi:hypothetical protein